MCIDRLAVGEAPACVQACPHEAIAIRLVDVAEVSAASQPGTHIVPGAFDSTYTKPATQYFSRKRIPPNSEAADAHAPRLEHARWPLITMLLLSQMAVGIFLTLVAMQAAGGEAFSACAAPLERTIRVLLPWLTRARLALFFLATFSSIVAIAASGAVSAIAMSLALVATFAAQLLERFSFFTAVTAPRMPGGV